MLGRLHAPCPSGAFAQFFFRQLTPSPFVANPHGILPSPSSMPDKISHIILGLLPPLPPPYLRGHSRGGPPSHLAHSRPPQKGEDPGGDGGGIPYHIGRPSLSLKNNIQLHHVHDYIYLLTLLQRSLWIGGGHECVPVPRPVPSGRF